ncbi:hypothetical protein D9M72_595610 [compost metagenome]
MEFVGHRVRPLHRDVVGQVAVGAAHPGERVAFDVGVEVHHLHQPVHAGIGAAGAQRADPAAGGQAGELREGGFELVLHRAARALALPALVCLAVVADAECQPHEAIRRAVGNRLSAVRRAAAWLAT